MTERVKLGVAYYPECWPKSEWKREVERMAEAGIDLVRLAEFAWSKMEIDEGEFDLDWLEEFVELAGRHGVRSVMCTPTEAPPPWLTAKYPETLPVDGNGLRRGAGGRRHCCINNPDYVRCSDRITEALGKRFGKSPNVFAWQLDNEAGCHRAVVCYCPECEKAFRAWLKERYRTVEALNAAWYSSFWSGDIRRFRHVLLHTNSVVRPGPQYSLDLRRFGSDSWIAFLHRQISILRPLVGKQKITHNVTWLQEEIDIHKLSEKLDAVGIDIYMREPWKVSFTDAWFSSIKKDARDVADGKCGDNRKHWVMEMPPGMARGRSRLAAARHRAWFFRHYLRGAELCSMWHWRRHLGGQEMWNGAVIDHDGRPGEGFQSVTEVGRFIREHGEILHRNRPRCDAVILHSYDDLFLARIHWRRLGLDEHDEFAGMIALYEALGRRGVGVTFARPTDHLCGVPLVFAPQSFMMTDTVAENLKSYVRTGGVLVGMNRMGQFDEYGKVRAADVPAHLTGLFGMRIAGEARAPAESGIECRFAGDWGNGSFGCARGLELLPAGADVLAEYTSGDLAGAAAVTRRRLGDGKAVFVGAMRPRADALGMVVDRLLAETLLERREPTPPDLEVVRGDLLTGYLNLSDERAVELDLPAEATDLVTGERMKRLRLAPLAVAIFENGGPGA